MTAKTVFVTRADDAADIPLPAYQSALAAGADLHAAIKDDILIAPQQIELIPTAIHIALPPDMEAQIRPRSGLAVKYGLTIVNAPGTIDADYRGEIKIGLINLGSEPVKITRGMRIAQMIIAPVIQAEFVLTDTLDTTHRGAGGFGSTGTAADK
ncbi:MAG: dUTP diphosphatase [Pseudomonadota bacterium]|jgi:dUTP pyrophosphatase|nr:dUTP diphosphatase [Pseudomonadota bacterium]